MLCGPGPCHILVCMNGKGSLPHVLNTSLEEYHTDSTLQYYKVVFDFGTMHKLHHWEAEAERLAAEIGPGIFQHKILFISVHSEVMCGDLFAGKDKNNEDVTLPPMEFMMHLFSGCLQHVINGSTVFMLLCGPLVASCGSLSSLKEAIVW
ncbi:hypothetical protein EDC04DRAFT_2610415 [Pisolithus marmoratus]|nr:hypothetical protein EDC04DRAFT_2610415 [Pisolithus marmoratus]